MRTWKKARLMLASVGGVATTVSSPSFAQQNTTSTNDMGPDGYSWAQSGIKGPLAVDQYNNLIAIAEDSGGNHTLVYSNDAGATWAESLSIGFITRGAIAYNSADDRIEICWNAQAATDGILYRAYTISRTGNSITGFAAAGAGYCILDAQTTGTMQYEHPCILWLNDAAYGSHGAVLCLWAAHNSGTGGPGNEIRCAMRILSGTVANDQNPANWTHIGVNSATSIGNAPGTASYTSINNGATTGVPHPALLRVANNDLFVAFHNGTTTAGRMGGQWRYKRATWASATNNWTSVSAATTISALTRAGSDSGYVSKGELLSKPVQDNAGNVYLGIATWKDNTAGDTWGYAQITAADAVTLVDTYSVGGAHSYAPTGDIDYDTLANRLLVSYIKTTTQAAYIQLYSGVTVTQSELLIFNSAPVDIPLLRSRAVANKIGVLFRDTNATKKGWFGTLNWG